ncbi:hypothetical protein B4923_18260 [Brenneria roseae subsp. americana]|uniref:Uncharacterized protein n=1 Tax=Brenneria roseae subsp. americana TaxID=1508507 RepID=A0A2U1TKA2_9GAMM|nr:hypothetical protein B4923_18260 [Brenneria roseae subsp. americana]
MLVIVYVISFANGIKKYATKCMVIYFEHQFFVSKSIIPISIILLINKIYHKMIFDRYRRIL